jgi:chromosome segregation ATPase
MASMDAPRDEANAPAVTSPEPVTEDSLSLFPREQKHAAVPPSTPWRVDASTSRRAIAEASAFVPAGEVGRAPRRPLEVDAPKSPPYPLSLPERADLAARIDRRLMDAVNVLEAHLKNFATQKERIDAARIELEGRVADARRGLDQRFETASAHQQSIERTMAEAEERLARTMSELDRRLDYGDGMARELDRVLGNATEARSALDGALAELPDHHRRLAQAEQILGGLQQRALEARTYSEQLKALDAEHETTLQTRLAAATTRQQVLEEVIGQLEERALQVAATLEQRVTTLDQQRVSIDEAARHLHGRTLSDASDLDRRLHDADLKKSEFDQVIADAAQTLSNLQAHLARIPDAEHDVANAERAVAELEARASAAGLDLDRRLLRFESHRRAIEAAIATASQAEAGLSELDRRVVDLTTGESGGLARAGAHVSRLEEMAAAATADLKRLARARNELKHELAHLQADVKKATKAAENNARKLKHVRKETADLRAQLCELSEQTSTMAASLPRRTYRIARLRQLFSPGVLLFLALVAVSAISTLGLRTVRRVESPTRVNQPLPSTLSTRTLPAPPLLTLVTATAPPPLVPEGRPTAIVPERRTVSGMPDQPVKPAATAPPFVGSLSIDSEPSGATVFVNRRAVGETPLMLDSLPIGSYVIRLELTSYQPWTAGVQVSATQQTRVSASLQK